MDNIKNKIINLAIGIVKYVSDTEATLIRTNDMIDELKSTIDEIKADVKVSDEEKAMLIKQLDEMLSTLEIEKSKTNGYKEIIEKKYAEIILLAEEHEVNDEIILSLSKTIPELQNKLTLLMSVPESKKDRVIQLRIKAAQARVDTYKAAIDAFSGIEIEPKTSGGK